VVHGPQLGAAHYSASSPSSGSCAPGDATTGTVKASFPLA
jgi:hypothetical protein